MRTLHGLICGVVLSLAIVSCVEAAEPRKPTKPTSQQDEERRRKEDKQDRRDGVKCLRPDKIDNLSSRTPRCNWWGAR